MSRIIRLEDEGTKRTTTQVLNIIQKEPESIIQLKKDEEQWKATKRCKRQMGKGRTYFTCQSTAPECSKKHSRSEVLKKSSHTT